MASGLQNRVSSQKNRSFFCGTILSSFFRHPKVYPVSIETALNKILDKSRQHIQRSAVSTSRKRRDRFYNNLSVSTIIFEKAKSFFPRSFSEAPMWYTSSSMIRNLSWILWIWDSVMVAYWLLCFWRSSRSVCGRRPVLISAVTLVARFESISSTLSSM